MPEAQSYNAPFWDAAAENRLVIQHCPDCDEHVYPPRSACPKCFGELEWNDSEGTGTLYSYTVIHNPDPPTAVHKEELPMIGCIVELEENVRIASHLVDCSSKETEIGMDVTVTFEQTPDGRSIPKFEPA